jgi:hypothetical protein
MKHFTSSELSIVLLMIAGAISVAGCDLLPLPDDDGSTTIPQEGLAAYYTFSGNAQDQSGNDHHCTAEGAVLTRGRTGDAQAAYQMDGDDVIACGDVLNDLSVPFTTSAWIFRTSTSSATHIFSSDDPPGDERPDRFYGTSLKIRKEKLSAGYTDGGRSGVYGSGRAFRVKKSTPAVDRGRWVHIAAVVRDSLDMSLYVDGQKVRGTYQGTGGPVMAHNEWPMLMGVRFTGVLDEVAVYDRALSDNDVRGLYRSE